MISFNTCLGSYADRLSFAHNCRMEHAKVGELSRVNLHVDLTKLGSSEREKKTFSYFTFQESKFLLQEGNLNFYMIFFPKSQGLYPPGGSKPLYQVYRYVPPKRVWFLSRFGLKTGIDFEHFGLKLGMVIGGTFTKAYNLIFLPSDRDE